MPWASLYAIWMARRRSVSVMARSMLSRHLVGVHDDQTLRVAGGAADGLDQARLAAQEALLVGVQDGHEA